MVRFLAITALVLSSQFSFAQLTENFETGLPAVTAPQGTPGVTISLSSGDWHALNVSNPLGTTGVFQGNDTVFPAQAGTSTSYAAMNFNNGAGLANISTFFMSPLMQFQNGDTISFFTRTVTGPSFPDRLHLKLSTNGASTSNTDFTTTLVTVNPTLTTAGYPSVWTEFTGTITGLSGPTLGRFAFHYDVPSGGPSGSNSDYIGIDTVVTTFSVIPEPMLGLALPFGLLLLRRRK